MPIVALYCPNCLLPQRLDHFETTTCGDVVHPDYVAAVLADNRRALVERSGRVGVSDGFGCPRAKLINDVEDVTVDVRMMNSMLTGTAWHDKMEATAVGPCEVEVAGVIAGVKVRGHIDRVRTVGGRLLIEDWKHTNAWSFKYLQEGTKTTAPKTPKAAHVMAVSIYAELYAQQYGMRPDGAMLWYHTTAGRPDRGYGVQSIAVTLLPIEQCLAFKPHGGEFSVLDLWLQVQGGIEGDWRNLPLAGESQTFGDRTMCDYCAVREVCSTAATGAPF